MTQHRFPARPLALAALLCAAGAAQATITFVTSTAALSGAVTDTFSDLAINSDLATLSLTRTASPFKYLLGTTYTNDQSDLFVVPAAGSVAVSTGWYTDALVLNILSTPVYGVGANFFGTNALGELASGGMTITVTDTAGTSLSRTISGGSLTAFAGFTSDVPLRFVTAAMTAPNTGVWASLDNVRLSAVPVPEPQQWALFLAGGAVMLSIAARRRG
jgi:hypothetical protein